MLTVSNLTYRIAGRTIFDQASFGVGTGQRVGVVGPNGAGKSTLFKLITGELHMDGGEISVNKGASIGMVRQDLPDDDTPLIDIVLAADTERTALLAASEVETDGYKIAEIQSRLLDIDAYAAPSRAAGILAGLGFSHAQQNMAIREFSGGWRMRVALAAVLFQQPDLLLLDEPTNHLDLEAMVWLENYLASYPRTVLTISHDRDLLNRTVNHILHITGGKAEKYTGTYDQFEKTRAEKLSNQQALYDRQQAQRKHMQSFIDRFRAKASKARQAQSRIKALERMELVDAVMADRATRFTFPQPEEMAPPLLKLEQVFAGYEKNKPVLRSLDLRLDSDDRIALLGANGNGKSTLIKILSGRLAPMGGEVGKSSKLRIGYFAQHQTEELDADSTGYQVMARVMPGQPESKVRARLGQFGFDKQRSDTLIRQISGGEKARLLFAVMSIDAPHILLLDEPTNHLDMDAREGLINALNSYNGAVVIVSHDPHLVERVADRLWLVEGGRCADFDGTIDDYRRQVLGARRNSEGGDEKPAKVAKPPKEPKEAKPQLSPEHKTALDGMKKKVRQTEEAMAQLARRKKDMEAQLADPAVYQDQSKAMDMQFTYGRLIKDLEEAEAAWMAAQSTLDAARG